ncbi:Serine-aspartate repeat-containing protein D, partial [Bienertia sinuspersici]
CLVDLPSVNWTDVADNWFGTCCCSFGGISDKLVAKYVKSYRCVEGTCLLTLASVILYKDDVVGFKSLEAKPLRSGDSKGFIDIACSPNEDSSPKLGSEHFQTKKVFLNEESIKPDDDHREKPSCAPPRVGFTTDAQSAHCCEHDASVSSLSDQSISVPVALQAGQKWPSKDIEWVDFACPNCFCTLGAYPCSDGSVPLDGGIRLFKCYISMSPTAKLSDDLFSKYTLERMFTCQLLESAKDELSFRTVVKDLKTKSSMLHIVLLNPNIWCCTGCCLEGIAEPIVKINLHPVAKVLFSHGYDNSDTEP